RVSGHGVAGAGWVGVRKGKDALKLAIEKERALLEPEIARLAEKYGLPAGRTISPEPATRGEARPAIVAVAEDLPSGRYLFNQHCAHCHAPNALSPEPSRDLRRLKTRYGERMIEITYKTVVEGRPTKGMPTWGDTFSLRAIQEIVAFLESVQN